MTDSKRIELEQQLIDADIKLSKAIDAHNYEAQKTGALLVIAEQLSVANHIALYRLTNQGGVDD